MSSATSLYRRRRPRSFADLVGQEPVVRTLRHAVERGKVHHAYLFVGSRGTGKTSMAKILAACLNCEHGPTTEPCGVCESCRSIASATSLDVIEMDAASNNSVDDIRELRESVAYAPVSGRHKVYILDEAHMLSSAAWNAFLKTLEEPPPQTIFVLATTEAQKVPATVIDRCHRFDFQRPTVEQIAGVVRRAAELESIEIPPPAVAAIARSATGSFRDALGTLEQLVTYSGPTVALADVLAVLGVADSELLTATFDAVAAGEPREALLALHRCVEGGHDASAFASDLESRARELLVVQTLGGVPAELSVTPESDAALLAQSERVPGPAVVRLLELLAAALEAVRAGADPRTQLELALVKAARPQVDGSTRALLARIERLEAALGSRPPEATWQGGEGTARPTAVAPMPRPQPRAAIPTEPTASSEVERERPQDPPHPRAPGAQPAEPPLAPVGSVARAPAAVGPEPRATGQVPLSRIVPEAALAAVVPTHGAAAPAAGAPAAVPVSPAPLPGTSVDALQALWPAVLDCVRARNALLAALIAEARPVALGAGELTVAFPLTAAFLKRKAEDPANCAVVSEALQEVTGERLRPLYELRADLPNVVAQSPPPTEEEWVRRFMTEFDAEELPAPDPEGN